MDDDSRGLVSAFTRAVRPDGEPERAGRRMLMAGSAGFAVVAAAGLLVGALGHKQAAASASGPVAPTTVATAPGSAAPTTTATTHAAPATTWTAVAGPDCGGAGAVFAAAPGSVANTAGGYTGDGCHGQYLSVPVSGNATEYDTSRVTVWTFAFAARYTACKLATYVPDSTDITQAGGDPAYYYVYATRYTPDAKALPQPQLTYRVSQVTSPGQWVAGQQFTVASGTVTVVLLDAGLDGTPATHGRHLAAADIRLTCHA